MLFLMSPLALSGKRVGTRGTFGLQKVEYR